MDFFRRQNWDLVGRSWIWFTFSGVLLVAGIAMWAIFGLNLGIDFTGGGLARYEFAKPIAADRAQQIDVLNKTRAALSQVNLAHAQVLVGGNNELIIRTPLVASAQQAAQDQTIRQQLDQLFGAQYGPITALGIESVGPVVGAQLRQSALHALILGMFLILLYITIRYEFRFAVAAIIALLHDVFIVTGAMALLRLELDSSFIAVILTVVGFSVHDTIVIFDRVRENMKLHRRSNFADTVNASLLQTMTRSIYTVFTVLLTLVALAVFASGSVRVFSIAMIIGIVCGAYSSIFNASQIVVVWERYRGSKRSTAGGTAPARRRERLVRATASNGESDEGDEGEEGDEEPAAATPGRRLSAQEAMARAEELAQEQKREERRARRKAKDKAGARGKSKKRF